MLTATVSGSFHRHLTAIYTAVGELREAGVDVLSPADPRVVDHIGEFLFVASDRLRSIHLVQDRHLECIANSSFLWLVAPDGYVGPSASMELGYAVAAKTPIFSDSSLNDSTLKEYVHVVQRVKETVRAIAARQPRERTGHLLIDPLASIRESMRQLDLLNSSFANRRPQDTKDVEARFKQTKRFIVETFGQ